MDTLIMKFGGASVATPEQFSNIADIIISRKKDVSRLVVVVSAMGKTTNQLIELAHKVHDNPPRREYDMLISAGERISISLLAMALLKKDCEAVSFTGSQSGIITCDRHTDARIIDVRPYRLIEELDQGKVVIIAGFQGVNQKKNITTLGRGGSDTTAVALGVALGGDVEFFKDVPGVFSEDPKKNEKATQYYHLNYEQALKIVLQDLDSRVVHERAVRLADKNALPLLVRSFMSYKENIGTIISDPKRSRERSSLYYEEG